MKTNTFLKVMEARHEATRKVIAAIPSDKLSFKPMPEMWSAAELALHLMGNYSFLSSGLAENKWDTSAFQVGGEYRTTEELLAIFDKLYHSSSEKLKNLPESAFDKRVNVFGAEQKVSSLTQSIAEHEIQHRGQMQVYLRLMGVKPS